MGDCIETMLTQVMTAIMTNDRKLAGEVSKADNVVDRLTEVDQALHRQIDPR